MSDRKPEVSAVERIRARITAVREYAKFIAIQHSSEFIDASAELGEGFYTANLYDEMVDVSMMKTKDGWVMVQNTYIASFAYNMLLCWMCCRRPDSTASASLPSLDRLLAHNLKKFFAEQLYRAHNCIASRALFLETLLYEQAMMVEVFAQKTANATLAADADAASALMSFALSGHELGHFYEATKPGTWDEVVASEPDLFGPFYASATQEWPETFATEVRCDIVAIISCLGQYESYAGPLFALRTTAFAFACYAAMYSAVATAKATGKLWAANGPESVDFRSVAPYPDGENDEIRWDLDTEFVQRARLVIQLCEAMAAKRGLTLFGLDKPFPLPATILEDLLAYVGRVFDCEDENARRMSRLVAKALHGHEEGMEYLYLRSKVFKTNRAESLVV